MLLVICDFAQSFVIFLSHFVILLSHFAKSFVILLSHLWFSSVICDFSQPFLSSLILLCHL
jgi:hypothetical protein